MVGDKLKKLRGKRSQEEIAEKIGISRARLSHYETGRSEPDHATLKLLADFYGVSTDYLIGKEEKVVSVAGKEIELSPDEFKVFEELKKHPVLFHDLATDTEKKVKQLIKMWEVIKLQMKDIDKE